MINYCIILLVFLLTSCQTLHKNKNFDVAKLKPVIQQLSKQWNKGLEDKDINVFLNLYGKNAHYLPNEDSAIHGNENIAKYWQAAFGIVSEINLNMESLQGNQDLLYETGNGTVKFINPAGGFYKSRFKYVNVWERQADGSYKVVIDTYNKLKPVLK